MRHGPLLPVCFLVVCVVATPPLAAGPDSCPGTWRRLSIPGAAGGIADILGLSDGTLVVGLKTGGLRFYERSPNGTYAWRSVTAGRGSISSNRISCLALFQGELWVGTADAGINIQDSARSWRLVDAASAPLPSDVINRLTPIPGDPSIWVSTLDGAAQYYRRTLPVPLWTWRVIDGADGLGHNVLDTAVHIVGDDRTTYFATKEQLYRWDGQTVTAFSLVNCGNAQTAERMMVDARNNLWFAPILVVPALGRGDGGGGGDATHLPIGLCRYSRRSFGLAFWTHFDGRNGLDMSLDPAGRLWTCSTENPTLDDAGGAWVHDQGTWCVFTAPEDPITSNQVSCVHATGELTWFGQGATPSFDTYTTNWRALSQAQLVLPGQVGPVAFLGDLALVGGTGGFSHQSATGPVPWRYVPLGDTPGSHATAFQPEGDGVWVGMDTGGLFHAAFQGGSVARTTDHSNEPGLAGQRVTALALDKGNRLWVGTSDGLLLRGAGYWLSFTGANSPLVDDAIQALAVDADGNLWIGTAAGGISVLRPEAQGSPAWTSFGIAEGLPSSDVRALAVAADGDVWAATAAGAAHRDAETGVWTTHDAAGGALPGNLARSAAIDSAGQVWIGTTRGLSVFGAGVWRSYHVTSSTLASDDVLHVATKGTEVWAVAQNQVALRSEIIGPIGEFPPEIASFTPAVQAPGSLVTVNGEHFDDRGPSYNEAFVGIVDVKNNAAAPAEIVEVTPTRLTFRVPDLADDGRIRVVSNCLEDQSGPELRIAPKISYFSPTCGALGDQITINGSGFWVAGGAQVRFGNGPWRTPALEPGGELRPDLIRIRLQAGDQNGKVQVRRQDGLATATSTASLSIGHIELQSRRVLQGVQGMRLIWGKRTLVSLNLQAVGCSTKVTGGRLYWKKTDGTRQLAGRAYSRFQGATMALDIGAGGVDITNEDFNALEFVGEFESNRSGHGSLFPLSQLAAVVAVVLNNDVEALVVEIPAAELQLKEIRKTIDLISLAVFAEEGGTSYSTFMQNATESLLDAARIFPQPDINPFAGSNSWMDIRSTYITEDSADLESDLPTGDFSRINATVDDLIEPGFAQYGMGLIDEALYMDDPDGDTNPSGKAWVSPGDHDKTALSYNLEDRAAAIIVQELSHMLGLVDGGASNHDDDNSGHSLYDECTEVEEDGEEVCYPSEYKTYSQAVEDQLGIEYPRMRRLTAGAPEMVDWGFASDNRAKSSMSYAKKKWNSVSFLEPIDQLYLLDFLDELYDEWADGGGGGLGGAGTTFNLRFLLSMANEVQVTSSHLDDSGEPPSKPDPDAHHRAVVLDAAGAQLVELPFAVGFHTHTGDAGNTRLVLRIPFPEGARTVELRHDGDVLWSRSLSAHPPTVAFTAPAGGSFAADTDVHVSWTASDLDGDALQFALDYSADGGATWIHLPQSLPGTSYSWRPGFLPKSAAARLRIRATDGFHAATALSAPFQLLPASPVVFIRTPAAGASIPEGSLIDLVAFSMTSEGIGLGTYDWRVDGERLKTTASSAEHQFLRAGTHTIRVSISDPSGLQAMQEIQVNVYPDFDRDGLPNDWEQEHGLNPLDATDASADPDGDGLNNTGERHHGTDPQTADTDGDGADDGTEVVKGTDPLSAASKPLTVPTLRVGATQIGFTVHEGEPASAPRIFWVTNAGTGTFPWSVQNSIPWLQVVPAGGAPPSEVSAVAVPAGLAPGDYEGQIVFTAPGAQESPHVVTVKLEVHPGHGQEGTTFSRADTDANGRLEITDPVITLGFLFSGGRSPVCLDAADTDDNGKIEITDAIRTLGFLFLGGQRPPAPFPSCGEDPTADELGCLGPVPACE